MGNEKVGIASNIEVDPELYREADKFAAKESLIASLTDGDLDKARGNINELYALKAWDVFIGLLTDYDTSFAVSDLLGKMNLFDELAGPAIKLGTEWGRFKILLFSEGSVLWRHLNPSAEPAVQEVLDSPPKTREEGITRQKREYFEAIAAGELEQAEILLKLLFEKEAWDFFRELLSSSGTYGEARLVLMKLGLHRKLIGMATIFINEIDGETKTYVEIFGSDSILGTTDRDLQRVIDLGQRQEVEIMATNIAHEAEAVVAEEEASGSDQIEQPAVRILEYASDEFKQLLEDSYREVTAAERESQDGKARVGMKRKPINIGGTFRGIVAKAYYGKDYAELKLGLDVLVFWADMPHAEEQFLASLHLFVERGDEEAMTMICRHIHNNGGSNVVDRLMKEYMEEGMLREFALVYDVFHADSLGGQINEDRDLRKSGPEAESTPATKRDLLERASNLAVMSLGLKDYTSEEKVYLREKSVDPKSKVAKALMAGVRDKKISLDDVVFLITNGVDDAKIVESFSMDNIKTLLDEGFDLNEAYKLWKSAKKGRLSFKQLLLILAIGKDREDGGDDPDIREVINFKY